MMKTNFEIRYANHPEDFKHYTTKRVRKDFLVQNKFQSGTVNMVYTLYDRMIIGYAMPVNEELQLENISFLETQFFQEKRETGIINLGGDGEIVLDGTVYNVNKEDALYIGKGVQTVSLKSNNPESPALFYINSCSAHKEYPSKLIKKEEANEVRLGTKEESSLRSLKQYIVPTLAKTCQLMMGITTPDIGSSWNTMPAHVHDLRMEAYFYFNIQENKAVAHLMGQPDETRLVWVNNFETVISPSWSIHSASGTCPYSFIWGMAGDDGACEPISINTMK